jgi:hypothetical protein
MAGRGPAPRVGYEPTRRGNRKEFRVVEFEPASQPLLPSAFRMLVDGESVRGSWPAATRRWWEAWGSHPLCDELTEADWAFLLDTALIHAAVWRGELRFAGELRQRVAKFGVSLEDRARLRVQFALADEADEKLRQRGGSGSRRPGLRLAD